MYSRVTRTLSIVGRQLTKKLYENTRHNVPGVILCSSAINSCSALRNAISKRNYCDKSSDESEEESTKLTPVDEEAEQKLKEFRAVPENERIFKIIELELEVLRQNCEKAPTNMRPRHWWEAVQLDSRSKRRKYFSFLFGLEKKKENRKLLKLEKQQQRTEMVPSNEVYRLGQNSLFLRIYESTMNSLWNSRCINSIMYGQPVVLDCSYDAHMNRREMKLTAKQLNLCFAENRVHDDPFNVYLCNVDTNSETTQSLHRFIPTLFDDDFPMHIKTESYLDFFDKSKLIYLSPHSQEEMTKFDNDAVYIIGAFVDKTTNEPVSMAKAKKLGIKTLRLPLDRYLQWGHSAGKNLTINAVLSILLDIKSTGDWTKALKHVPRRKISDFQQLAEKRKLQKLLEQQESDGASGTEELQLEESLAVQMLTKKGPPRFDEQQPRYKKFSQEKNRSDYHSSYKNDSQSHDQSPDAEEDFSMEARARLKKNFKN